MLIGIAGIILFLFLYYLIGCSVDRKNIFHPFMIPRSPSYSKKIKIPWKILKNIYHVNPDRLRYEKLATGYYEDKIKKKVLLLHYAEIPSWGKDSIGIYYENANIIAVKLSMIGKIQFLFNKFLYNKRNKNLSENQVMRDILNATQKDIDKLRKKAEQEIDYARKINDEIG